MIRLEQIQTIDGNPIDLTIASHEEITIKEPTLTLFPGLIDPHVHFRTPGMEEKEDWKTAAQAAIAGGYTTVFDMPNTLPPTITKILLTEKKNIIDAQLQEIGIPLRYQLFFGADKNHLDQIARVKDEIVGIKVFMGCSTGNLVIDDDESLEAVFKIAAENDLIVAVHAEDEHLMKERKKIFVDAKEYPIHSEIRNVEVARRAVEKAINLTRQYGTRLYILHVSSTDEIELIRKAKQEGLQVFAETTPHHLFLNDGAYAHLHGKAVVNPPLRSSDHQKSLFKAIEEGVIDTIGSDHAPHTLSEKEKPYGMCPSGMPGIETTLALLLNAYHDNLITLEKIVSLTSKRAKEIFRLPTTEDYVLVDLNKEAIVSEKNLKTKCGWSSFAGKKLKGWASYTILDGKVFKL